MPSALKFQGKQDKAGLWSHIQAHFPRAANPDSGLEHVPGKAHDWTFAACTIVSYVLIAALAFAVHPALGVLALWLGFYIAPVAAVALMVVLPIAVMAGAVLAALAFAVWYFAALAAV